MISMQQLYGQLRAQWRLYKRTRARAVPDGTDPLPAIYRKYTRLRKEMMERWAQGTTQQRKAWNRYMTAREESERYVESCLVLGGTTTRTTTRSSPRPSRRRRGWIGCGSWRT